MFLRGWRNGGVFTVCVIAQKRPEVIGCCHQFAVCACFSIRENLPYFQSFEKVILYYDNGQHELNRILNTVLATKLSNYELRKVLPCDYRLFQAADLICTLELTKIKLESRELSKSEQLIFHSKRDFKKDFLKGIRKKEWS